MKMKLYYGALALIWLLSGCERLPAYTADTPKKHICTSHILIDNHLYGIYGNGIAHMGTCKQCKHELDSIVKNAVNEAIATKIWKVK